MASELDSIVIIIFFVVFALVARSIVIVPAGVRYVVERLGVFDRVLPPGVHVTIPFFSRISNRIPIREQNLDIPATDGVLQNGAPARVEGSIEYRVVDAELFVTNASDATTMLVWLTTDEWTKALADAPSQDAAMEAIRAAESKIRDAAAPWGIEVLKTKPSVSTALKQGDQRRAATLTMSEVRAHEPEVIAAEHSDDHRFSAPLERIRFAVASGTIAPGALGLVEMDERTWTARNQSAVEIPRGFRCVVEGEDGQTLLVRCL